ncbi:MAG TPA: hypothetical protein VJH71_00555 [Candidatus Paceibacterota bacterium]
MINKLKLLKVALGLGVVYYLVGAYVHFFGVTLFPWYDGRLYTPYHDSLISLVAVVLALILITLARNPIKNIDMLRTVIFCLIMGSIFSIVIIYKIDFSSLGSPAKKIQTITEGVVGFIYSAILIWLYPRKLTNK